MQNRTVQNQTTLAPAPQDDRVLPETRLLGWFVSPFLIAAAFILLVLPTQTGALFAWPIKPPETAMMLGSAYLGGLYFFIRVMMARQWHTIKAGFLPVTAFASMLCIATLLHWDRFTPGHVSFIAWAGVYFVAPFLVLGVWLRNRRSDPLTPAPGEALLPGWVQWLMRIGGAAGILLGGYLFILPGQAGGLWPWSVSPLTARVIAAMVMLAGITDLGVGFDRRWSAAKIGLQTQAISLVWMMISAFRDLASFDLSRPAAWIYLTGLAALLIGIAALHVWMPARRTEA